MTHGISRAIAIGICAVSASFSCASPSHAQDIMVTKISDKLITAGVDDVSNGAPVANKISNKKAPIFDISTDDSGSSGTLSFAFGKSTSDAILDKPGIYHASTDRFSFSLSMPISKSKELSVFDFGGLKNVKKMIFGYSHYSTDVKDGRGSDPKDSRVAWLIVSSAYMSCVRVESQNWLKSNNADADAATASEFTRLYDEKMRETNMDGILAIQQIELNDKFKAIGAVLKKECDLPNDELLIAKYQSWEKVDQYDALFFTRKPIFFYGADGTVGQGNHEYLDQAAFSLKSTDKTSIAMSAYVGWIDDKSDWALRGKISYTRDYEDGTSLQICRPITGSINTECITGASGLPTRTSKIFGSIEAHRVLLRDDNGSPLIAVAPLITYDTKDKEFAAQLPIFLTGGNDGKLSGGVRVGYSSKSDDFGAGLFVGIPFQVPF